MANDKDGPRYYEYDPSLAASTVFIALFGLSFAHHAFSMFRYRTWYFIPFFVGVLFQFVGYIFRDISIQEKPDYTLVPFLLQVILILVAPAVYAASIYMLLGRIVRLLDAEHHSIIRTTWVTKIFVGGDVLSFLVQVGGGAMFSSAKTASALNLAKNLITIGLVIQLLFFGLFLIVITIFHYRIVRSPTTRSSSVAMPWRRFILVLYTASAFILIRSLFRLIEYQAGRDSPLQKSEVYFYIFDSTLMIIVALIFNVFHPRQIVSHAKEDVILLADASAKGFERVV